jgi:hypothetical protein
VLDRHGVEYLIVGGIAARAHGARRETQDLDCLIRRSKANLARAAHALLELHARLRVSGMTDEQMAALPLRIDPEILARSEISTWRPMLAISTSWRTSLPVMALDALTTICYPVRRVWTPAA